MSDDGTEQESPLDQFVGLFQTPEGRGMAETAQTLINDYQTQRQIADANTAAGDAFAANLHDQRSNYVGLVQSDPHATDLALNLAQLGVGAMVGTVPGTTPEQAANIATGMQRDIAVAAVRSLAEQHEGQARELLDSDRISALVGDHKDALHGYITAQSTARQIDEQGRQRMMEQSALAATDRSAWNYMASMVDPDTGEIGHPPGWAQKVMADETLPPPVKAKLFDTYGRLQEQGDAETSDPAAAYHALSGASPTDILGMAGDNLRAADAVYLARLAADPKNSPRAGEISDALSTAQNILAAPENGPAGQQALERFTNWMLPAARNGADLNPRSEDYALAGNMLQNFAPRASDIAQAAIQAPVEGRRPLSEIFGGR